jgi:hypothetical protein
MRSPLGIGPGAFHHATERRTVDTVYLGAFRRSDFLALGGMRTMPRVWQRTPTSTGGCATTAERWWSILRSAPSTGHGRTGRHCGDSSPATGEARPTCWRSTGRGPRGGPLAPLALVLGIIVGTVIGSTACGGRSTSSYASGSRFWWLPTRAAAGRGRRRDDAPGIRFRTPGRPVASTVKVRAQVVSRP